MADDEDLRFTMELKDEFTEVFDKIKENVSESIPKLKSSIGGLSKALAVVGAGAAIGGAIYASWNAFKNHIADVTKEAEKLEVTLANILGSRGAAKAVLEDLASSDLTKVFSLKELDQGYTTLANHGLKATLSQMKAIGDLSAGTGQDFQSVINDIIRGSEGKMEGLQNLGISVTRNKNKKAGIDELTLSFRGQTTTIQNNNKAIQDYLLNLGKMEGVQGSMGRSADTVTGSEMRLKNQFSQIWENLSERFTPGVIESKNQLTKFVAKINDWIKIPVSDKLQAEIVKIRGLQTELTSSNTTEERRKKILEELKELNPKITDGIDAEAINYKKLADNIDLVTDALTKKITLSRIEKSYGDVIDKRANAISLQSQATAAINDAIYAVSPELAKRTDLSIGQKQLEAFKILKSQGAKPRTRNAYDAYGDRVFSDIGGIRNEDGTVNKNQAYLTLQTGVDVFNRTNKTLQTLQPQIAKMNDEKNTLVKQMGDTLGGVDSVAGSDTKTNDTKTSIDKGGIASVNGGGKIKNVIINIQNLVSGGVNVHTTTLKEGVSKAKDIVVEGLLTAVNDANLVGD